ncbi:T/G mismatch-specific endonuclease [Nitrobacter hamburgensis X14]|uniref:Very short patch repair endonuclease n=1 Tax=Nitrobacter hamburgensis (strain DSM 10229 / NCIMB 13809 / X14) TaxID=323097 RepID=Q1QKE7_NITHX|nr:very short patch repair endonuclease [Nitrobacter hamburgensis]ABE63300.1 T/G mismatch-specific endonuclease [Nitrobacter hamburgensis X14]
MVDRLTPERRSWLMSRVGGKNTTPEIVVRKVAHSLGLRFRLHRKQLPGTPDLVFPKWRTAIFVHGCFWHRHPGCAKASTPKSRTEYWQDKFETNVRRDKKNVALLRKQGWLVLTVWECETKNVDKLGAKLSQAFKKRAQYMVRSTRG